MGMSSNQGQSSDQSSFYEQAMERTRAMMEARKAGLGVANTVIVEPAVRPNGLEILKALASSEKPVGEMRGILAQVMHECDWCCLDAFEGDTQAILSIDSESVFWDYLRFVLSDFLRPGTSRKRFRFAAEVIGEQDMTGNGNPDSALLTTEVEFRISLNDDFIMKSYWLGEVKAVLSEWTEYLEDPQTGRSYRSERWSLEIQRDSGRSDEECSGSALIERLLPGGKVQRLVCDSLDLN